MVQDRSVLGALEELRVADASGAQRLDEEIGAVNTSFSKQLETEIATKDGQIANLRSEIGEQIANLPSSLTELRAEVVKKDQQIANLTADLEGFRRTTTKDIRELKACVCVQKPAPLFALSSQVLYPTSYTYPEDYETRPLIPVPGYNPSKSQFDVIDISSRISIDRKYVGGVLAPNGHIYMVPYNADSIGDFSICTGDAAPWWASISTFVSACVHVALPARGKVRCWGGAVWMCACSLLAGFSTRRDA